MSTMVFGLAHGIIPHNGGIEISVAMIVYATVAGAILAAMRLRSGSLLFGMIGHDLIGLTERLG
jgi:membrane protease YdiL (CAAX protease family)